jgi:hypothetical protein
MQRGNALSIFARMRMRWFAVMSATAVVLGVAAVAPTGLAHANFEWSFENQTSVPLWGEMHSQCGKNPSDLVFDASHALQPQKSLTMPQQDCPEFSNLYQWGRLCYDGHWWNLTRAQPYNSYKILFRERTDGGRRILFAQVLPSAGLVDMVRTDGCG